MNPTLKAFLDFLAATPGARLAVLVILVCAVFSPRVTSFVGALALVTHMLWINP